MSEDLRKACEEAVKKGHAVLIGEGVIKFITPISLKAWDDLNAEYGAAVARRIEEGERKEAEAREKREEDRRPNPGAQWVGPAGWWFPDRW